jgi:hypothetical protein
MGAGLIPVAAAGPVSISVTQASTLCWPVAAAIDTRCCPALTKCCSPTRYTSIGGMAAPRRWASATGHLVEPKETVAAGGLRRRRYASGALGQLTAPGAACRQERAHGRPSSL